MGFNWFLPALALVFGVLVLAVCGRGSAQSGPNAPSEAADPSGSSKVIDVDTLHSELKQVAILVDVRTAGEYGGGHVPGAVNIPLQELPKRLDELSAYRGSTPVYVICQSGGRSRSAASQLSAAGYDVVDVQGGTGAWKARGYPFE